MTDLSTLNDAGNADRLAERLREDTRYLPKYATWVVHRGGRWSAVVDEAITAEAIASARDLVEDAEAEEVFDFAVASLNIDRIRAAVALAQAHDDLLADPDELDGRIVGLGDR